MAQTTILTEKRLDEAELDFRHAPGRDSAADLLTVATVYWNDDMIGDETYAGKIGLVCNWLAMSVEPVEPDHESPIADVARRIASYADGRTRINVYRAAKIELTQHARDLRTLLIELSRIVDEIGGLPLDDDGTRDLPPGMLDRAREIAAIAQDLGNAT